MISPGVAPRPRVLLGRPAGGSPELARALAADGFDVVQEPFIAIIPGRGTALSTAAHGLARGDVDLLVLTSARALPALAAAQGTALTIAPGTRIAVVGRATAEALAAEHLRADVIAEGSAADLARRLGSPLGDHAHALLPLSAAAGPLLERSLIEAGWQVQRVDAYQPVDRAIDEQVTADLASGGLDAVVLTSSSIARRAAQFELAASVRLIAIGEATAAAAREAGLRVAAVSASPDPSAVVRAARTALAEQPALSSKESPHDRQNR